MTALSALTERVIVNTYRDLDLVFAVVTPLATFVGFMLALGKVIDTGSLSYPQYLLPITVIQATVFSSMTTADRAARDQSQGFGVRMQSLPIAAAIPLTARMLYCLLRGALGLIAAFVVAYVFGFRLNGGAWYAVAFVALFMTFTLALSLAADAVGTRLNHIEAASQILFIPQMLLVLLSTGLAPVNAFPEWLRPFVTHQPVSQITETLRHFTEGRVEAGNLAATMAWCVGMLVVFGMAALRMQRRPG
jgi:ABC-2 type transport system permease protein